MKNLKLFLKTLFGHFWALMSCAVFTCIGIVAAWRGESNRWIVWTSGVAALLLLLFAGFLSWRDEHTAKEVALVQRSLPELIINLHTVSMRRHPTKSNVVQILTQVSVRNLGTPSIMDTWKMELEDNPAVKISMITMRDPVAWQNRQVPYLPEDQLHHKIGDEPVPTGGKRTGVLWWNMTGFDFSLINDQTYRPSFLLKAKDVNGVWIRANDKAATRNDDTILYYPGLSITPPLP